MICAAFMSVPQAEAQTSPACLLPHIGEAWLTKPFFSGACGNFCLPFSATRQRKPGVLNKAEMNNILFYNNFMENTALARLLLW
jgi:hypothetical protein